MSNFTFTLKVFSALVQDDTAEWCPMYVVADELAETMACFDKQATDDQLVEHGVDTQSDAFAIGMMSQYKTMVDAQHEALYELDYTLLKDAELVRSIEVEAIVADTLPHKPTLH